MRHHSFMRWASAAMAALMFFQCTTPVAFATDDTILAESSIAISSADSESVPVDSDAGYIPERPPENTSVDSSSMNAASSEPLIGDSSASSELPEDASSNGSVESQPESDTDQISTSNETTDSELAESSSENTDESAKSLYQDGKILIYTCDQLAEIGSGQTLTDASGLAVADENGAEITYALDAQYAIAEDIELTDDMLQWQLPEGFAGSITPLAESSDDLTLYDAQSDTIYLYNPYQLSVLQAEDPAKEPVLDGDAHADSFGMLTNILNVIPGLGLGDLITILLGNAIPLGKLIPTGYINAKFADCSIDGLNISASREKDYAGGFVGQQSGSIIENCTVKNSSPTLQGKNFVGGFVGLARDSIIKGTLSGALDIETKLPNMNPESLLLNCTLDNKAINIQGENYVGGFAGGLANTSAVNCSAKVSESLTVHATGANAGGFAGIATLGWAANLGKDDNKDDLLGGVVDLVVKLLSSNPGAASSLLSLAGVNPSYILGCTVDAPLTVNGTDYVGGVTGRGDGAYIAPSSTEYLSKVSYWRNGVYAPATVEQRNTTVSGLQSVSGHDYTGGIAGSLGTASVAGLLNTTLGVASYLAFTVDGVTLNGITDGFSVSGNERVGGGFGDAIGGTINNVSVNNLKSVEGKNYAGGFIGLSGPGELVGTDGGLTVNLLGLNYLLKLNNLLSLGQAVEVTITNANVKGIESGFTVEATGVRDCVE